MGKIITSIFLSIVATQAGAMTIDQFEQILTQEEQEFYLAGLADGIVMGNAVNAAFGNPVDMCIQLITADCAQSKRLKDQILD